MPNPKDLEGVEEDQLLEIQYNIQDKLKEREEKRERNITKRMKQYKEKYDFINKALLENVTQITEMTKSDHPTAAARVKSADKMVIARCENDNTLYINNDIEYGLFQDVISSYYLDSQIKDDLNVIKNAIQIHKRNNNTSNYHHAHMPMIILHNTSTI